MQQPDKDVVLTPDELSTRWRIAVSTLKNWRVQGRGPTFIKLGENVRYKLSDVLDYEKQNEVSTDG